MANRGVGRTEHRWAVLRAGRVGTADPTSKRGAAPVMPMGRADGACLLAPGPPTALERQAPGGEGTSWLEGNSTFRQNFGRKFKHGVGFWVGNTDGVSSCPKRRVSQGSCPRGCWLYTRALREIFPVSVKTAASHAAGTRRVPGSPEEGRLSCLLRAVPHAGSAATRGWQQQRCLVPTSPGSPAPDQTSHTIRSTRKKSQANIGACLGQE